MYLLWFHVMRPCLRTNIHLGVRVELGWEESALHLSPDCYPCLNRLLGAGSAKVSRGLLRTVDIIQPHPYFIKTWASVVDKMLSLVLEGRRKWILWSRFKKVYTPIPNKKKKSGHQFLERLHLLGGVCTSRRETMKIPGKREQGVIRLSKW